MILANPKRIQMSAETTIPSNTINHQTEKNKIFHDKTKFKQYLSTNPALQKTLEGKLQHKEETRKHRN